ncbi:MAG: fibronectin type III domain-containing protein [Nitrospirae bacterium]|nr:fibronectin type III domain-containing protein [Nitrospirota bacterium]
MVPPRLAALTFCGALAASCAQPTLGRPPQPQLRGEDKAITVSWGAAEGASSYEVFHRASDPPDLGDPESPRVATKELSVRIEELDPGLTYYVSILALRGSQRSQASSIASVTTVPPAPGAPDIAQVSKTTLRISWKPVTGAIDYELYYDTESQSGKADADRKYAGKHAAQGDSPIAVRDCTPNAACAVTLSGLVSDKPYVFSAKAINGSGASGYSEESKKRLGPGPYPPPPLLKTSLKSTGLGQFELSWEAVENAVSYEVLYDTDAAGAPYDCSVAPVAKSACPFATTTGTTLTLKDLKPDIPTSDQYHFAVIPISENGVRGCQPGEPGCAAKEAACATESVGCRADPPVDGFAVKATTGKSAELTLSWSKLAGATGYDLLIGTSTGAATGTYGTTISLGDVADYVYAAPSGGTKYYLTIRGRNGQGAGRNAAEVGATTIPSAPASLSASASYVSGQVSLKWTASTGATSYKIYYDTDSSNSTSSEFAGKEIKEGISPITITEAAAFANCSGGASTDRCTTLTALTTGSTYSFAVQGVNESGEGALSSTTTFVPLAAPSGFSADGDNQITFSWSAVPGASGYKVYSDTETNGGSDGRYGTTVTTVSGGSTTSATATVSGGSTLFFAVTAVWSGTTSPASESAYSSQQALADAPTGFIVRGCTGQTTLLWNPLSGATDYYVYYASSACTSSTNKTGCYNGPATPVSGTSYKSATAAVCANSTTVSPGTCSTSQCAATITGLTNGTTYYFSVRGGFDGKKTPFASELSAVPLAAPTGLSIASCGSTSANLSWTAVTGAASYQVCVKSTSAPSAGSCPGVQAATGTTATVTSLSVGTNYFFTVDALSGSTSTSDHSSSVNTTLLAAPTNADVISPNAGPSGRVTLSWTYSGAGTPAGYKIYYQTASSVSASCSTGCITGETAQAAEDLAATEDAGLTGVPSPLGAITTTATTYTMTGLDALKDYYFKVAAVTVSPLCESDLSSEINALVGWPKTLSGGTHSTPLIDDLVTGDSGKLEVFVPDTNGNLYLFNEDGVLVGGWGPVALGTAVDRPAVSGDIDGDGALEIVFTANSTIYAYENTGVAVANFPKVIGSALTSPVLGNLDGDAALEIFVGAASGTIYAINGDATDVAGWAGGIALAGSPAIRGDPVIADIDVGTTVQDSANEIIFGGDNGKLYVYNHDGTVPAGWPATIATVGTCPANPPVYNGVAIADIDGDRDMEIFVAAGSTCTTFSAFHHTGATVSGWPKDYNAALCQTCCATSFPICPSPATGDINGDGATDIVAANFAGYIYVFNSSGVLLSGWAPLNTGANLRASPEIVNVDSDLVPEVIIATAATSSNILAYNYDGSAVSGFPKSAKGAVGASISVADIDSNNVPELFVVDTVGRVSVIHAASTSFSNARVWPMFMRDPSHVAQVGPRLETGWPRSLAANVTASPVFGNLDGGTDLEVAVANVSGGNGRLFAAKWNGALVTGWTAPADDQSLTSTVTLQDPLAANTCDDAASTSVLASPALGNLDGATDTNVEAFISTAGGNTCAYAFDHDSTRIDVDSGVVGNAFDAGSAIEITAALANADGGTDTNLEAIFGSVTGNLYVKNVPAGTSVAGWPVAISAAGSCTATPALRAAPAVGDVDDDSTDEIVIGGDNGCIYAFELSGALVGGFPLKVPTCTGGDSDAPLRSSPAIGNLNTDTKKEIVFGADNNCIYAYKDNGGLMTGFPVATGGNVRSAPALGNLDSDTALEIVVGSDDGKIYALNGDGTALSGWPVDLATSIQNSPALVDVNGDGNLDIVVAVGSRMYAYDRTGTSLPGFPFLLGGPVSTSSPQAGDLRNDRTLHLSVGTTTDNRLYVFTLGYGSYNPDNCKGWLGFHNAQERTGVNTSPSSCP